MIKLSKEAICYGCGVCEVACRQKVFSIQKNKNGFFGPISKPENCNNCGLCDRVCSFIDKITDFTAPLGAYSYSSYDFEMKQRATSGAFVSSLTQLLIQDGYKIVGVKYDYHDNIAKHDIAVSLEDTIAFSGSKYIQSYTVDALKYVFDKSNAKEKFAIFGTPCQIANIKRLAKIRKVDDNHLYIDLFCHGTPSYWLWDKYLALSMKKAGINHLEVISFRNKKFGWHNFTMGLYGDSKQYFSSLSNGDLFYEFFLFNTCLNEVCYDNCQFKNLSSYADIRIGDLWGEKYKDRNDGVSGILTFSVKGDEYCKALKEFGELYSEYIDIVTESQLKSKLIKPNNWQNIILDLKSSKSLEFLNVKYIYPIKLVRLFKRIIGKIKRTILCK